MNRKIQTLFFVIGLILFAILVVYFGIGKIIGNIGRTGWWFLPIIGVWGIAYFFNALSWSVIINRKKYGISFSEIYGITLSGFAINYITPVMNLGGEPYRIMALKDKIGFNKAVSSTISYTMIHFLSHFFFWITGIMLATLILPLSRDVKIIFGALFVLLVIAIIFFISKHRNGVFESLISIISKLPMMKKTGKKIKDKIDYKDVDKGITEFYRERRGKFYLAIFLDYSARIIAAAEFYFILLAIGINITLLDALYISAATSLITNILFFMPMELGTREGGSSIVMESLHFAPGIGIYISVIYRVREFFWIFIGLLLIRLSKTKKVEDKAVESV